MSIANDIRSAVLMERDIRLARGEDLSINDIAKTLLLKYQPEDNLEPHVEWTSLEHLKQMTRATLRETDDPVVLTDEKQQDIWAGHLQQCYPRKLTKEERRETGGVYALRENLSWEDWTWNIDRTNKASRTLAEHARMQKAFRDSKFGITSLA